MFQSIEYLIYVPSTNRYIYHLIDSDFECTAIMMPAEEEPGFIGDSIVAIIPEYLKRNYSHKDIVKNIILHNIFMIKVQNYDSFEEILKQQNRYTDKYYRYINFSSKYYQDVLDYWNAHKNLQ